MTLRQVFSVKTKPGFTIVELLIVVVVIAILAAITIVSYNGITKRAETASLKSELGQTAKKLGIAKTTAGDDAYPGTLPSEIPATNDGRYLMYTRNDANSFCLSIASIRSSALIFNITEAGQINDGYCAGHQAPIATTNAACFAFDSGTKKITSYYNNEGNDGANPACPRAVGIPSTINGVAVTSIGLNSFLSKQLTSVTIPNSVTTIDGGAFWNNQLTSVTIPSSVTSIDYYAFRGNQLTSAIIPDSVTNIGDAAFFSNKLASVTVPSSLTSINSSVFNSNRLTSVTIPSSVTSIGDTAFGSNQLASVTIPGSVTSIGSNAFGFNKLTSVTIPGSVISIGNNAFASNLSISCAIPTGKTFTSTGCASFTYY